MTEQLATTDEREGQDVTLPDLLDLMASHTPDGRPMLAGTFALYPDRGGVVLVMDVREGAMPAGQHRGRIPSGMIRALSVLAGGGGKLAAIRALAGRGRH